MTVASQISTSTQKRTVSHPSRVCESCRTRKQKCDGDAPCGLCSNRGLTSTSCVYIPYIPKSSKPHRPSLPKVVCASCRSRKEKCDRVHPKCGSCSESGRECEFPEQTTAGGSRIKGDPPAAEPSTGTEAQSVQPDNSSIGDTGFVSVAATHPVVDQDSVSTGHLESWSPTFS